MPLLRTSLWKAFPLAAMLALASFGACKNGEVPIGQDQQPIACSANSDCPDGSVCASGFCAQTCATDSDCPTNTVCTNGVCTSSTVTCSDTLCGAACVDLQTDALNCGACAVACAAGQACVAGVCTGGVGCLADSDCLPSEACINGQCTPQGCTGGTPCSGGCVDLTSDPQNCGACGVACPAGETCAAGVCTAGTGCNTDADCPASEACVNGQCTTTCMCGDGFCSPMCGEDLLTCPQDCATGCSTNADCPAGETCMNGVCTCSPSDPCCGNPDPCCGSSDPCCGNPAGVNCNGTCADLATDAMNCGACGAVCPAGEICAAGACTVLACNTDADCPANTLCKNGHCSP